MHTARRSLLALCVTIAEAWASPLPNPLTLEQALALADEPHPELSLAYSQIDTARAQSAAVESINSVRAFVEIVPEIVQPATSADSENDGRARILINKRLYDFGRTGLLERAAAKDLEASELGLLDARHKRRVDIMSYYFEVLLADMRYAVDNEDMAYRYVVFDEIRHRHDLGQRSDVELQEADNNYREALIRRTISQKRQAATRARLATALNRPDEIPGDLVKPKLPIYERDIPNFRELLVKVSANNPAITKFRRQAEAAKALLEAERSRQWPTLSGEMEAAEYEREFVSRSRRRIGLNLQIPLYQRGENRAAQLTAAARLAEYEARLRKAEYELRLTVLTVVQDLETLKIKRTAAQQRVAFRDISVDRARARFELEMNANLGDASVRLTEAQWMAAQADYEWALTWARIDALAGTPLQTTETALPP